MGFKKMGLCIGFILFSVFCNAQKIEKVFFNVYTDSLKRGVHNYINVDAKLTNGKYIPLTDKELHFTSNYGVWQGNSLYIDSTYKKDSVLISISLKTNPSVADSITLFIKKWESVEKLKTQKEFLEGLKKS